MGNPIVYVDRSQILEGKLEDVKAAVNELVEFIDTNEPQLISYGVYLNQAGTEMTVVVIHPDSASLEFHMDIGGPAFRKFVDLLKLATIEVYGKPSETALHMLHKKAEMLGGDAVIVRELQAGFARLSSVPSIPG